ncbi:MAG TPA: hypothetical protein VLE99_04340 [Candidatus Saccharimonadales bacterium]|nr:hypothetical protein [Candidatus Saccharimonadales bacterium]
MSQELSQDHFPTLAEVVARYDDGEPLGPNLGSLPVVSLGLQPGTRQWLDNAKRDGLIRTPTGGLRLVLGWAMPTLAAMNVTQLGNLAQELRIYGADEIGQGARMAGDSDD